MKRLPREKAGLNNKENSAMGKRLRKSSVDRKLFGVCGGLAEYFNIDSTIIRLIWVVLMFCVGTGFLAYILAAIVMPEY